MTEPENDSEYTRSQHMLAAIGQAHNQCPSCGVYTADGKPPALHRAHCTIAKQDRGTFRTDES